MKKIWPLFLLFGITLFTNSCDNSVDLTADFKDIPVVYGILSQQDTFHYIKIERAFLGGDGDNALDIAQIPDSIYYDNLDVQIEHVNTGEIYPLTPIDGSTVGLDREDGIFASDPNTLYTFTLNGDEMNDGDEFMLRINRGDNQPEITASTEIIGSFDFTSPTQEGANINIKYTGFSLTWKKKTSTAFYDVKMLFNYLEEDPDNIGNFESKTLEWPIATSLDANVSNSTVFSLTFEGEELYRFLGAELDDNGGADRIFVSLDFVVEAGGQALFDYINIGQANTGITSSQLIPTYTNLSEGFGVFSSRTTVPYVGFTLKAEARDSLANGIHTKDLGFQN